MNKSIKPKAYSCSALNDLGSLSAKITTAKIENNLYVIDNCRTNHTEVTIHSTIQQPTKLNQLLLEVLIQKTENPKVFCHEDEKHYCIGVFNHYPKISTSNEFCCLSLEYEEKEFNNLIQLLNQAHANEKMKLWVNIEVLGLNESCEYTPDKGVLLVKSAQFIATSFNPLEPT